MSMTNLCWLLLDGFPNRCCHCQWKMQELNTPKSTSSHQDRSHPSEEDHCSHVHSMQTMQVPKKSHSNDDVERCSCSRASRIVLNDPGKNSKGCEKGGQLRHSRSKFPPLNIGQVDASVQQPPLTQSWKLPRPFLSLLELFAEGDTSGKEMEES